MRGGVLSLSFSPFFSSVLISSQYLVSPTSPPSFPPLSSLLLPPFLISLLSSFISPSLPPSLSPLPPSLPPSLPLYPPSIPPSLPLSLPPSLPPLQNMAVTDAIQKVCKSFSCNAVEGILSYQLKRNNFNTSKTIILNPNEQQR